MASFLKLYIYSGDQNIEMHCNKPKTSFVSIYIAKTFEIASFINITAQSWQNTQREEISPTAWFHVYVAIGTSGPVSSLFAMRTLYILTPFIPQFLLPVQ